MATSTDSVFVGFRRVDPSDLEDRSAFLDAVTDIPSQAPSRAIPVARAGVAAQALAFTLRSFVDGNETISVSGDVSAGASLPVARRGVHMSRIVSAIDAAGSREWPSLAALLTELATSVARLQDLPVAGVEFDGRAVVHRSTPVTGMSSPDTFGIFGEAQAEDGRVDVSIGLRTAVMTACPCTQAFGVYSTVLELADRYGLDMANEVGEQLVSYTHSQRADLSVALGTDRDVDLVDLYEAMDAGAHVVHDLLKRPDEHYVVRRAHQRPQFTEDVVREVAAELVSRVEGRLDPEKVLSVSCRNLESIHAHDAHSLVEGTLGELAACLEQPGS